jgi:prolyl oligopeptidase
MKTSTRVVSFLLATILTALATDPSAFAAPGTAPVGVNLPPTSDASDTFFGHRYEDPYRPLENFADKRVEAWYRAEAQRSEAALAALPGRDMLVKEWLSLDARTPPKYADFAVEGGRVFYRKTMPGESVGKLFVREGWQGKERLLLDPLTYHKGEKYAMDTFSASMDGTRVLVKMARQGAEWGELRVLDVADGRLHDDLVSPVWFNLAWLPDGTGFLYNGKPGVDPKDPHAEEDTKLLVHRLGTPMATDVDLMSTASTPGIGLASAELPIGFVPESDTAHVYALAANVQSELKLYVAPAAALAGNAVPWRLVIAPSDALVRGFAVHEGWIYAVTYRDAPHYRLVRTRLDAPDWAHAESVLPEAADSIVSFAQSRSHLLVEYSNGVQERLVNLDLASGKSAELRGAAGGTLEPSCPDSASERCLVTATGWVQPRTLYDADLTTGAVTRSPLSSDVRYPEFDNVVADELEVRGHDGVMIPVSIIHRKDLRLDGSSPCILDGYGAYGISLNPEFSVRHSVVHHGVIYVYAHVRGGSEKGEAWYRAGFKATKPNTWKDFNAVAEWLVQKGYTSRDRLTGRGTSAGGILISRAITDRPDLYAAAVVNVGDANILRSEFSTNGPPNVPEFGSVQVQEEAGWLAEMDGLQHVHPGVHYPAVLGVGGWNDPRVPAWQPAKFIAAVRQASTSGRPVMMLVNFDDGHFTEDKRVTFRNFANQFAFALWQAGHPEFQPPKK